MSAQVIDLQARTGRQDCEELFIAGPPDGRYARLADEASATLAAVRADGRSSRALRERLDELTRAISGVVLTERAVAAIWDEAYANGCAQGAADVLAGDRAAHRRARHPGAPGLRPVPDGSDSAS